MDQTITVSQWHEMALAGTDLPMRIPIHGVSMYPLIRKDRDLVTILPVREPVVPGDIVLFSDPAADRYVLHRVIETDGQRVLTWGDNCAHADGWIPMDRVWGKARLIERGRLTLRPDPRKGLRWARFWRRRLARAYLVTWRTVHAAKLRLRGKGGREDRHGKPEEG